MYKKITSIVLMLLVIARSEKISAKNVAQGNFLNLRLSTILPYLLHNDQNHTRNNAKRSHFLLMPPSQTRDANSKEIAQKIKRCGILPRKNRFFSLSRKENSTRADMNARSLDRNIKIPRQNSNADTLIKNIKYLQENHPVNRMKTETRKDNTFLRALRNNMNAENVILNLKSRGKIKKCNTDNCICYCKDENCLSKSSMTSSSEILSSSRKDKSEKINHQRPAKHENTKSNILQQISSKLYHKNLQELPSLINSFPTRFYQERIRDIPHASILYGKKPHILPYIVGNDKNFVNIGVPFTSFENRANFPLKSKADNQYQPIIHQNLYPCSRIIEESQVGNPMSTTSASTSYVGAATSTQTESDLKSIEITGKDEKHLFKLTTETPNNYVDKSINSETEINFYPNYSNDVTEESSTVNFSSTERIKEDQEFSKLMPFFTNYIDKSRTPSIVYPSILHNDILINMEECIKLFGRDVCVLSATSPKILAKQTQENNMNEYSTIKIPEYIVQMSRSKEGTTLNNVNYSDKFETINTYVQSNIDSNEHLESTNTELNVDTDENSSRKLYRYEGSIEQTYEPDDENKLFNTKEDTRISMNKLMDQVIDKTMESARNTLLGKSKSHIIEPLLNPNNKETVNSTSSEIYFYSTNSYEYSNDQQETINLKVDQETLITDINVNSSSTLGVLWNTLPEEETTTISYDFKTEYNFEEKNRNYVEESDINIYTRGEISQEQLKEEDTTINHDDSEIRYNFKEEVVNKLNETKINTSREKEILRGQSEEITTISYDSTAIYNFEEETMYDLNKLNTDSNLQKEIFQEWLEDEIIPVSSDSYTEYNFEETTENNLLDIKATYLRDEIPREQPVMQYLDIDEKTNYLNDEEDTINSPETIIDSSSRNHTILYRDDTLLLNSIRKVINDFASNASLSKTENLDENILRIQGRSLLPEILQVPNLESILSIPQIENTIVEKVKDVLSDITAISRKNFTNDWSHDMIKNTFRSMLQTLSTDFYRKLPPMTIEEHQFKNGQWSMNSITLAPVPDSELSIANPENLEKSMRNLLNFSVIASQADQYIIRNMIVQSVKNSLTKDEHEEIDNSIIHMLNNILQTLRDSKDTDMLKKNNRFDDNKKDVDLTLSQEVSAGNYEEGINIGNSILIDKQNLDIEKNTERDNEKIQLTSYQESKGLENNANMIISNLPSSTEYKKDVIEEKRPRKTDILMHRIGKNFRNQIKRIQKIDVQDNEVKELAEPLKNTVTYNKAISQNNLSVSEISIEPIETEELNKTEGNIFSEATTISSIMTKNFDETKKDIVTLTPIIKNINANDDNNKSSINYSSLDDQILRYIKNDRINNESIQVTIIPTNFVQKTSPNYAQISNGIISENIEEVKDLGNETEYILNRIILTKPPDNLISSTDVKYRNEKSEIASSTDEIDPAIILERIEHNLSPIKYYSPEILKYIKNHYNAGANVEITTTSFMKEISPDYTQQMSNGLISRNIAGAKDVGEKIERVLNDKTSTTSANNVISSLNVDNGNYKSEITSSIDTNILDSQQQNFISKDNIIAKIHEATTEVQRTYAKTTYFKVNPSVDDSSRLSSFSSDYRADANNNDNKNKNSNNNDSDNLIGNEYNADDITTETNKITIPFSKSCCLGDIYPLQLFPLLIASDNSELEKSQLYYINDGMKLPLEIRKLKDGFYELSIAKNICEQILERKCSYCMPLQGHVILSCNKNQDQKDIHITTSSQENICVKNVKKDYYSTESPNIMITVMTTGKDTLRMQNSEEEEEERMNAHYHWKRNLNDNNLITFLMPVIDFAKKHNLLLDFNKGEMLLNETGSHDIMQNYDESLIKAVKKYEYDRLEKKNLNDNFETKKDEFVSENKDATDKLQNLVNFRERKDTMSTSFSRSPIFRDLYKLGNSIVESWEKNAKANQFEITEDLHKVETDKNIQNINTEQKINSKNRKRNSVFKRINISKEDTEIKDEEMKSNKYQIADIEKEDVKVFKKKREKGPQQTIEFKNQERIPISRIIISGNKVNMKSEATNWDKSTDIEEGNVFHKKEKKEHKVYIIDDKQNDSRFKNSEEDSKKPYRYQRNINGIVNKRAEIVKSMLHWLKGLFLDK
ncbi:protein PFC0760c [Polyergus mexicanus]|uniref:protein PFC0760c n=1 Tax=Polyergus mexicanus TaxID=615972 RepID=UPI0038B62D81